MTQRKPLPDIARCACGKKAEMYQSVDGEWWRQWCWAGEGKHTQRGAIQSRLVLTVNDAGVIQALPVWALVPFSISQVTHWREIDLPEVQP